MKRTLSGLLAAAMTVSLVIFPAEAASSQNSTWPNMGPTAIQTETKSYENYGQTYTFRRSVRDPKIRPANQLILTSDSDYLARAFQRSLDYAYDELVVGPEQFPLNETDSRITKHFNGEGNYTSTAVPSIWGTYHGFPGGGYRECFCDRDVSHTAEACSLLSLNEENYDMLRRFAEESVDLWWRETDHNAQTPWSMKGSAQRWFPLWSQDFYGDAFYMDASFRELPAPFEVLDKIWTQYRWTGDERWIGDEMLNYGYHINAYENGLMDQYDYDGDGLVDNVHYYDWAPTLYEYEDASELQREHVAFGAVDQPSVDSEYPFETTVTLKPDFFLDHNFYQLPIDAKIIGVDQTGGDNMGEQVFVLRNLNKPVADPSKPAVLRNYDRLSSQASDLRDVVIPLYVPAGVTFKVYEGRHELRLGIDYSVDSSDPSRPVVTLKKEFFSSNGYESYVDKKISLGIVTRFYGSGGAEIDRSTTELYLNTGNVVSVNDRMNLQKIEKTVGGDTTDVTGSCERDQATGVIYLDYDYASRENTSYTLTIRHKTPITPRMTDGGREKKLKEYFKVTSDLVRVLVAGDTIGCQYQALRGMAEMIRARVALGKTSLPIYHYEKGTRITDQTLTLTNAMADEYDNRADAVQQKVWRDWTDETWGYARAINRLGERDGGWGHENSFFMPMKELLQPGNSTQKYLNFIQMNALMDEMLNEEALTYMPETFYMHGQNTSGWQWAKVSLNRLDPEQKTEAQIMSTYPEIALINIYNAINLLMGVEPSGAKDAVSTLPRLTDEVGWVQVENIPLTQSGRDVLSMNGRESDGKARADSYSRPKQGTLYTVRHDGVSTTAFTNQGLDGKGNGDGAIEWSAKFYGDFNTLYITKDGKTTPVTGADVQQITYPPFTTYTTLAVAPGETVIVSTLADLTEPAPNTDGFLYLSDFDWATASWPTGNNGNPPMKNATYKGAALYRHDFQESWAKGIGTRANTTLRYLIPTEATRFTAKVALTDFKRQTNPADTTAQVTFRVYVDNELKATVTADKNSLTPQEVAVDLTNSGKIHTLDLVTTAAGSSSPEEGAAWLDAKIAIVEVNSIPDQLPGTAMYLSDLTPESAAGQVAYDVSRSDNKPITMGGRVLAKGLSTSGETDVTFGLGGVYQSLNLALGYQDGRTGETKFQVYLDGAQTPVFDQVIVGTGGMNAPIPITVSLETNQGSGACANTVRLVTKRVEGKNQDTANWGDCLLTLKAGTDLTDPAIIAKRILSAPDGTLGQTRYAFPAIPVNVPGDYTISIVSSSNPAVLALDGTITPDGQEHLVNVVFRITELVREKRIGDTKSFTVYIPASDKVSLTRLKFTSSDDGNGRPVLNQDNEGKKLKVDGLEYTTGLGLRAAGKCEAVFSLENGAYKRFTAKVGYAQNSGWNGNDSFRIIVEGIDAQNNCTVLYSSPVIIKGPFESNSHLQSGNSNTCNGSGSMSCLAAIQQYGYATSDNVDIDIPAGYQKLAIRAERIGDSFWGYAAAVDPYFYLASPYEGKNVESIDPCTVQTVAGTAPKLPQSVKVKYQDVAAKRTVSVVWDAMNSAQYAPGKENTSFTVLGTASGIDSPRAVCTVEVKGKIVLSTKNVTAATIIGTPPTLPAQVEVTYNDNGTGTEAVDWITDGQTWSTAGRVEISGTVRGTSVTVKCTVTVIDPAQVLLAALAPESASAPNGLEYGQTYPLGGKGSYPNSIFAHADSTLIYNLEGKYTRFVTETGIKTMGENPNVIFRAYGIDAQNNETLLYNTNMVTGVSTYSTTDQNGYYYVGGSTVYHVDVNVTGYQKLKLVADSVGTPNTDHSAYGTPTLYSSLSPMGQNLRTVTVTSGAGGAVWPNGRVAVANGGSLTFTIKPNPASNGKGTAKQMALDLLRLDGATATSTDNGNGTYTLTVTGITTDRALSAIFKEKTTDPVLGSLAPTVATGDGKVTLSTMTGEMGETFYYKTTAGTDIACRPSYGATDLAGWTAFAANTHITGENGTAIYVQVVKVADGKVVAWGEASATPTAPLYGLTITGGAIKGTSNSYGSFAEGAQITVTADTPPSGYYFTGWVATGVTLTDTGRMEISFTMPAQTATLTANFEPIPVLGALNLTLTPADGKLILSALAGVEGEQFYYKTTAATDEANKPEYGDTDLNGWTAFVADTDISGPNGTPIYVQVIKVTDDKILAWGEANATPATHESGTYLVTIANGKLPGGARIGYFVLGTQVAITADEAETGRKFSTWSTETEGVTFADASSAETEFTMPDHAVAITANFKNLPSVNLDRSAVVLYLGGVSTAELKATVLPAGTDATLTWSSDDEGVVTVTDGVLTAVAKGGAVVTVTAVTADGSFVARCVVTVANYVAPPSTGGPATDSGTTTEKNPDGSVTTTVTDRKTGTVTAETKYPDGRIKKIVTQKSGIITQTITEPTGKRIETVTTTAGRTITVTSKEGETLAELNLPASIPGLPKSFGDMEGYGWAREAVDDTVGLGLFSGTGRDSFSPGLDMSRGMLVTALHRLSGKAAGGEHAFSDVESGTWYADAVAWAAARGVVEGSDGRFAASESITREQLAVMLYRYAALLGRGTAADGAAENGFADAGAVSGWAREAMAWAVDSGILKGKGGGMLDPSGTATRAEAAAMLLRFVESLMK